MKKSILAFGFNLPDIEGFEAVSFNSDRSMLDADIIAVEPNLGDFHVNGDYAGTPRFSEDASYRFRKANQRWRQQIETALEVGKTVVFFLTERVERFYYTGDRHNEGTPGRPRVVHGVASCSNYDFLPIRLKDPHYANGSSMVLDSGGDTLSAYWKTFGPLSVYQCYFDPAGAQPLVLTRSGRNTVGCFVKGYPGALVILPEIQWGHLDEPDAEEDEEGWPVTYHDFVRQLRDALLEIDSRLRKDMVRTEKPGWSEAEDYRLAIEPRLEAEILTLEGEIEEMTARRARLASELAQHGSLRGLLYESGHALEEAVRGALVLLGFHAEGFKQDGSEFDALFTSPEGRFLGEVEGKESKPVNVDKLAQLHRNIAEDLSRDEVNEPAIPVLFGNAQRLLPPAERGDFFTEKAVKVAPTMNVALVRTPDLFAVARYVKDSSDEAFAAECRMAIRTGAGSIVSFPKVPETETAIDIKKLIG